MHTIAYASCPFSPETFAGFEISLNGSIIQGLPENYAPLLVENIKKGGFTHVFAGNSAFGKNLMPRVAAILDTQQISDITAIESEDSKKRQKLLTLPSFIEKGVSSDLVR